MSESLNDETCLEIYSKDSLASTEYGKEFEIIGVILCILSLIYFPLCALYFYKKRKKYDRIRQRSIVLASIFFIGVFLLIIASPFRLAFGVERFKCVYLINLYSVLNIFVAVSGLMRLIRLRNRVFYSKLLLDTAYLRAQKQDQNIRIQISSTRTLKIGFIEKYFSNLLFKISCWSAPKTLEKELKYHFFLTTTNFTMFLLIILLLVTLIPSLFLNFYLFSDGFDCVGCLANFGSLVSVPLVSVFTLLGTYFVYKTYSYPDVLGIKKENLVEFLILAGVHFGITLPLRFFFPQIEQESKYDLSLNSLTSFAIIAFYATFYQVRLAKLSEKKSNVQDSHQLFETIINIKNGRKVFAVYLTYSLAIENLLFYEEVTRWRNRFEETSTEENLKGAREICKFYVLPGSAYEINVGYYDRKAVLDDITLDEIEEVVQNVFDKCFREVEGILSIQFSGFLQSKLYKVYKSDLGQVEGLDDLE